MKKIDSYYNYANKIKTNIYETKEGMRVIESISKNTIDYDISVIVDGGAYYEDILKVPHGTAHLLEHICFGNPNSFLKTTKDIVEYRMGNKRRASFDRNATTSPQFYYFFAHGHENAKTRMIRYIFSQILFPKDKISKYLEKERKIVLAEKGRRPKDEKWEWMNYMKKIFGDEYKILYRDVLGEIETIKSITAEDISKYYDALFRSDNMAVTIQSSKAMTASDKKAINELSKKLKADAKQPKLQKDKKIYEPIFGVHTFKDENQREVFMSINYFYNAENNLDSEDKYLKDRLYIFLTELINKVSYDFIREEKNLTYDIRGVSQNVFFENGNRGLSLSFSLENFEEVLDSLYTMIEVELNKFLNSKEGLRWLNNILSFYIYLRNNDHDEDYSEGIGVQILDNDFSKFNFKTAKKVAKKITPKVLMDFVENFFKIEPIFWISSAYEEELILEKFKKSKFYRKYAKPA